MAYERYPRNTDEQGGRREPQGYRGDDGFGSDDRYRGGSDERGAGDDRYRRYGGAYDDRYNRGAADRDAGRPGYGQGGGDRGRYGASPEYHGSYASDGHRFEDVGRYAHADDDARSGGQGQPGRQPQGREDDRGFLQRAGDEVRSWFGDEEAERRRDRDRPQDERSYGDRASAHRDSDYHNWRSGQIAALDRDYEEYRQEHRSKFENEFASWRTARQGQRDSLSKVAEHMEVVGSDGEHVGTVDKVRGDRILLTKNDADAGGHHHSIPSRWVESVEGKVALNKSAAEAKRQWQDEERNQAMFQYGDHTDQQSGSASAQASSRSTGGGRSY